VKETQSNVISTISRPLQTVTDVLLDTVCCHLATIMHYAETLCSAMYFCLQFLYISLIYAEYRNTGFSNYDTGHMLSGR